VLVAVEDGHEDVPPNAHRLQHTWQILLACVRHT
jgi:hypothetical protein